MTPEERQLLGGLFDRIREAAQGQQQRDVEAEAFINNAIKAQPYAPYLMAQTVIIQEETMKGAVQKIEELEAKVRELEARAAAPQPAQSGGFLGGIGRSVFGSGEPPRQPAPQAAASPWARSGVPSTSGINVPPPPQQQYGQPMGQPMQQQPMAAQPGPWQQQPQQAAGGSSFLKGALGAAAGVAGGMLLANAVSGMFRGAGDSGHHGQSGMVNLDKPGSGMSSSVDKDSSWGNESKSAGNDSWSNSSPASGDEWSSGSSGGSDGWDNSSSASGDEWDSGDSDGGDSGGDE